MYYATRYKHQWRKKREKNQKEYEDYHKKKKIIMDNEIIQTLPSDVRENMVEQSLGEEPEEPKRYPTIKEKVDTLLTKTPGVIRQRQGQLKKMIFENEARYKKTKFIMEKELEEIRNRIKFQKYELRLIEQSLEQDKK